MRTRGLEGIQSNRAQGFQGGTWRGNDFEAQRMPRKDTLLLRRLSDGVLQMQRGGMALNPKAAERLTVPHSPGSGSFLGNPNAHTRALGLQFIYKSANPTGDLK